mmetsp:Transcript_10365/g.10338  ORF Transcript_10365/g.10338 Transcript_10365/m.10338 type:complete len:90 (-) Transcript_10365:1930-2199(-)
MRRTPNDIESLEEEKINPGSGSYAKPRNRYSIESDLPNRSQSFQSNIQDYQDITLGEAQKHREGRESYYTFPIYHNGTLLVHRRYREFV